MSDRNMQLQTASLAERSKSLLAGHPMSNWRDNLGQLHADMLANAVDLRELISKMRVELDSVLAERDALKAVLATPQCVESLSVIPLGACK